MLVRALDRFLAVVAVALLVVLAAIVLYAVAARTAGASPPWYDELAAILLAWLSFIGAALATLRNAHLNFENLLVAQPPRVRATLLVLVEIAFLAVFALMAWYGARLLEIFGGETLTSLRGVPRALVHAVVPVAAALTIVARLAVLPGNWRRVMAGRNLEHVEIDAEIARAQAELARGGR